MAYWFYYNADGQKQGAVTEEQLKELAANGKITPGTTLEHAKSSDKTVASEVKWLTFGEAKQPQASPPPPSIEPIPPVAAIPPVNQPVPQSDTVHSVSDKKQQRNGYLGCAVIVFVLFLIGFAINFSPEKKEKREQQKEQRAEQRNQTANEQLKKKIEKECDTMFRGILGEYYKDDFTTWQRMSSTVVNVTRLDDDGYALIDARIEVDAPASQQRPGEPQVKKRGGARFERKADGRYFISRVTFDSGDLRFVESEYLKGREIKLDGANIKLGDRE